MAPKYNLEHATKDYPFMTCLVRVNTRTSWQKTVAKVLNKCHGVYSFRMGDEGLVEVSGTVDPKLLLKVLGKSRSNAELRWFQFGECSSNLFMQTNHSYTQDGRYLHSGNVTRPKLLPSQEPYGHSHDYGLAYDHKHDYDHAYDHDRRHNYGHACDYQHSYDHKHDYQCNYGCRDDAGMGCCIIM